MLWQTRTTPSTRSPHPHTKAAWHHRTKPSTGIPVLPIPPSTCTRTSHHSTIRRRRSGAAPSSSSRPDSWSVPESRLASTSVPVSPSLSSARTHGWLITPHTAHHQPPIAPTARITPNQGESPRRAVWRGLGRGPRRARRSGRTACLAGCASTVPVSKLRTVPRELTARSQRTLPVIMRS